MPKQPKIFKNIIRKCFKSKKIFLRKYVQGHKHVDREIIDNMGQIKWKKWATHIICICIYIIDEVNYSTKFISLNFLLEVAPE